MEYRKTKANESINLGQKVDSNSAISLSQFEINTCHVTIANYGKKHVGRETIIFGFASHWFGKWYELCL